MCGIGGAFGLDVDIAAGLHAGAAAGFGLAAHERDVSPSIEREVAAGVKLTPLSLLPFAADVRHPGACRFRAAAGTVAHRARDNLKVGGMVAFGGGDGQVVARAQVERIGRIELCPRERDIGAAQANVAGA